MPSKMLGGEKSKQELELERKLFGDASSFFGDSQFQKQELALFDDNDSASDEAQVTRPGYESNEDEAGKAGLTDEQLFSWDAGDVGSIGKVLSLPDTTGKVSENDADAPAWVDSDDEQLIVSLATHSRLRKLRMTEAEDAISGTEYSKRLRAQYETLQPPPEWASPAKHRKKRRRTSQHPDGDDSEVSQSDEDEEMEDEMTAAPLARLLQSSSTMTYDSSTASNPDSQRPLRSGTIDMHRLKDVGETQPSVVETLSFHPTVSPPLILSSGPSGLLSMHHITSTGQGSSSTREAQNPLLTSLAVRGQPISTAVFHPAGSRIFFAGRRRFFHIWNLPSGAISRVSNFDGNRDTQRSCEKFALSPCGRYMALVGTARKGAGCANILDAVTGQWIAQARVEGRGGATDVAWWSDGEGLLVLSKSGEVVEYSIQARRIIARWKDEGAVGSTVIALGGRLINYDTKSSQFLGPDRWVAIGGQSGIVNVYDRSTWKRNRMASNPSPTRVLEQLITPTSILAFSPDGQLLVMASRWKRDAARLIHLPSCTVYKNWPTSNTPLGRVSSVAWAPNSKILAFGNEAGKIRLFQVRG